MTATNSDAIVDAKDPKQTMVEHILLLRWTEHATQEAIKTAVAELLTLKNKIPGIIDLSFGENFSERAKGFTHGLVMRFKDRAAMEAYLRHPEHQRVAQNLIHPIRADSLVLDFEF